MAGPLEVDGTGLFGISVARPRGPRVAIVHDYLAQRGGAERVALELTRAFPDAILYTTVYNPASTFAEFGAVEIRAVPWLNRVRWLRENSRLSFPVLPWAIKSLGDIDADVVLCSSSGWSHAVSTRGRKLVYCHNPPRWLYQPDAYFATVPRPLRALIKFAMSPWRRWDGRRARTADAYLANSANVASRIRQVYGRSADVVHPPRGLDAGGDREAIPEVRPDFYLTVSRKRGYKRSQEIVRAFEGGHRHLVQVGGQPVTGENVTQLSGLSDGQLRWLYANARALIAIGDEDFGLTPVEAYAMGTPAIVLAAGGYLETSDRVATIKVRSTSPSALHAAMDEMESMSHDADLIRAHAEKWAPTTFHRVIRERVYALACAGVSPVADSAGVIQRTSGPIPLAGN